MVVIRTCLSTFQSRCSRLGGSSLKKRRKSLVHRLILNDQTFLSPYMTGTLQEMLPEQSRLLGQLSCSSAVCLRNHTTISTDDLLGLCIDRSDPFRTGHAIRPLEDPFPFESNPNPRDDDYSSLRTRFFQQPYRVLPENLQILLTTSSSIYRTVMPLPLNGKNAHRNQIIEYLLNYAYSHWNNQTNQFEFAELSLSYHQQIIAPLLDYAKYIADERAIHLIERTSSKFDSELPFTFGYVLAPSMSVYNETFLHATEIDRREAMLMMDLFANLIHRGYV
jgi:hypothetical protein